MVAQHCECSKCHWIIHFKWLIIYKFHLNKLFLKCYSLMQNWKKNYCVPWNLPVICHSVSYAIQLKNEYIFISFYVYSRISELRDWFDLFVFHQGLSYRHILTSLCQELNFQQKLYGSSWYLNITGVCISFFSSAAQSMSLGPTRNHEWCFLFAAKSWRKYWWQSYSLCGTGGFRTKIQNCDLRTLWSGLLLLPCEGGPGLAVAENMLDQVLF